MSNWARVIVAWSGIDDAVRTKPEIEARVVKMAEAATMNLNAIVYPCPIGEDRACEAVATFSANHFIREDLEECLAGMAREMPEDVEFFWKDESANVYRRWCLANHGDPTQSLRLCPGCEDDKLELVSWSPLREALSVACKSCGLIGPGEPVRDEDDSAASDQAIRRWNELPR